MSATIGRTVLLVRDPEEAAAFYHEAFGFQTLFDADNDGFRLLHVGPGGVAEPGLWLFPVEDDDALGAGVGQQTRGAPCLVLYVEDLEATLGQLARLGVEPHVPLTAHPEQPFAHVRDLYGNEIVLVQLAVGPGRRA